MNIIYVDYSKNKLAGTGKVLMEKCRAKVSVGTNLEDEMELREEVLDIIGLMEGISRTEIKILGFSLI